jgi:proteasome assembly chaperone 3
MEASGAREEPFPARTRTETGTVNGIPTEATSMFFSDKIVVTISQEGRLSQWVRPSIPGQLHETRLTP